MRDKVLVRVMLAATQQTYEFRVAFDIQVAQAARLMERMLAKREGLRFSGCLDVGLMLVDGPHAGSLLAGDEMIRALVLSGVLVDGRTLALV